MARVTVEDCTKFVNNRFELVLLASIRAREISSGSSVTVKRENDKNSVVALREIASETLNLENLREVLIKSYQKSPFLDEHDSDNSDFIEVLKKDLDRKVVLEDDEKDDLSMF